MKAIYILVLVESIAIAGISSDLTGDFVYESGSERDDVAIYVTVKAEGDGKFSLALMAAHPDGHGAAPDGDGEGRVDHDGVLRFPFQDSFFNKGTGTFQRTKDGYVLSIHIADVQDARCLAYYGEHTLQRKPREKESPAHESMILHTRP